MIRRGEVFRLKNRVGFAAKGTSEAVLVVQDDGLNDLLPTVVIVPLDPAMGAYAGDPMVLRVPAAEVGASSDHAAVVAQLRAIRTDALAPGAVGRASVATLAALSDLVRTLLSL